MSQSDRRFLESGDASSGRCGASGAGAAAVIGLSSPAAPAAARRARWVPIRACSVLKVLLNGVSRSVSHLPSSSGVAVSLHCSPWVPERRYCDAGVTTTASALAAAEHDALVQWCRSGEPSALRAVQVTFGP